MKTCLICNNHYIEDYNYTHLFKIYSKLICDACYNQLAFVQGGCENCGKKTDQTICDDCFLWKEKNLEIKNYALLYYNEFAKAIIREIKFNGNYILLYAFKSFVLEYIKQKRISGFQSLIVPLHKERLLERGFNQSQIIASFFPFKMINCLEKVSIERQSQRKKEERMNHHDFQLMQNSPFKSNKIKKLMVVDDLYTTGSTIHQIYQLLKPYPVKEVVSFTLFRS